MTSTSPGAASPIAYNTDRNSPAATTVYAGPKTLRLYVNGRSAGSTTGRDLSTSQSVLTGTAASGSMGREPSLGVMRVIAGSYGGRILKAPKGDGTRPTSDRVREALFSILGDRVQDARVLDLFAGSGALGLEALSRGAQSVTFVDDAPFAVRAVRANADGVEGAEIIRRDARAFL